MINLTLKSELILILYGYHIVSITMQVKSNVATLETINVISRDYRKYRI